MKRTAVILIVLSLLAGLCSFGAAETSVLDGIRERGVLRVGSAGDYRPMSFLDPETGTYAGFDVALAEDLAAELGVAIEYVKTSWPTLMEDTLPGNSTWPSAASPSRSHGKNRL